METNDKYTLKLCIKRYAATFINTVIVKNLLWYIWQIQHIKAPHSCSTLFTKGNIQKQQNNYNKQIIQTRSTQYSKVSSMFILGLTVWTEAETFHY